MAPANNLRPAIDFDAPAPDPAQRSTLVRALRIALIAGLIALSTLLAAGTLLEEPDFVYLPPQSISNGQVALSPSRVETRTFVSQSLGRRMPYDIYLPPGYDSSPNVRFPVLYLLHGMSGTNEEWRAYGVFEKAEALFVGGEVRPYIIVLPQGDYSYWVDHANGGPKWGAYTAKDVVIDVDRRYRTELNPGRRAIGGLSMGGHGALQIAVNYPGVFGVIGAHSPSFTEFSYAPDYFGDLAWFTAHDPQSLYRAPTREIRNLIIEIDVGRDDHWKPQIDQFHNLLDAVGISHLFIENDGEHERTYWIKHTTDYLRFYGTALAEDQGRTP